MPALIRRTAILAIVAALPLLLSACIDHHRSSHEERSGRTAQPDHGGSHGGHQNGR